MDDNKIQPMNCRSAEEHRTMRTLTNIAEKNEDTDHILQYKNDDMTPVFYEGNNEEVYHWMVGTAGTQIAHALQVICKALQNSIKLEDCKYLDNNNRQQNKKLY